MKVIEITSRLFMTTTVRIICKSTLPNGHAKYWSIWEGDISEKEIPNEILEKDIYAIEAVDEDSIAIHI